MTGQAEAPIALRPPAAYHWWMRAAEAALRPLAVMMCPGASDIPIAGQASNHGAQADRLESFARPCLWASHWLAAEPLDEETLSRESIAEWFRQGLVAGTDPSNPGYWGPTTNFHQHTVEMAALVLALEGASEWLWEPLGKAERDQVADWIGSARGVGLHRNNHLFFGVLPLSFLHKRGYGRAGDRQCILRWMDILESMHLGGGWFIDGMNESVDHYNAFAFHYYGLWWGFLYGEVDQARARRWQEWTRDFLSDYVHFFAASGEPVPFGRSLTYRFATSAPFALAEKCGISPLAPGLARRLCTQNLKFFIGKEIRQSQGALSLGWRDEFPAITEAYSCGGSPYWAAKGLSPLLLSAEHPFWTDEEKPLPAEESDFSRAIPQIGMVVRGTSGEVELLNAATSISGGNTAFGAHKWGRLSFRTGIGWEVKPKDGPQPLDAALSAESKDGTVYGRQPTYPIEVAGNHIASVYALGDRFSQFNVQVESHLWWRGGWQLHCHKVRTWQSARLILGACSLAAEDVDALVMEDEFPFATAGNGDTMTAVQALAGFHASSVRLTPANQRVHILAPNSLSLSLQTDWIEGETMLLALAYAGAGPVHAWNVMESGSGRLVLAHGTGTVWKIEHETLPPIEA